MSPTDSRRPVPSRTLLPTQLLCAYFSRVFRFHRCLTTCLRYSGLFSFASTTLILSLYNTNARGIHTPNIVIGMALFCGGLAQFLAGMWEFACGNTLGATGESHFHLRYSLLSLSPHTSFCGARNLFCRCYFHHLSFTPRPMRAARK